MTTKTAQIFSDKCPYNNASQSQALRLLFVCSVGMLRSPTAQVAASNMGFNARACGADVDIALIPLSVNLIQWADRIIFMTRENYEMAIDTFKPVGYDVDIFEKHEVWSINDHYNFGDNVLYSIVLDKLKKFNNRRRGNLS